MSAAFTPPTQDEIVVAVQAQAEWLELCWPLIDHIEKNWKASGVYASYSSADERIHVNHIGGHGHIFRTGRQLWIHFPSNERLKEFESDYDYWSQGKDFIGWASHPYMLEDITLILDIALKEFVAVSEKLNAATVAAIKLEDLQNGYSDNEEN